MTSSPSCFRSPVPCLSHPKTSAPISSMCLWSLKFTIRALRTSATGESSKRLSGNDAFDLHRQWWWWYAITRRIYLWCLLLWREKYQWSWRTCIKCWRTHRSQSCVSAWRAWHFYLLFKSNAKGCLRHLIIALKCKLCHNLLILMPFQIPFSQMEKSGLCISRIMKPIVTGDCKAQTYTHTSIVWLLLYIIFWTHTVVLWDTANFKSLFIDDLVSWSCFLTKTKIITIIFGHWNKAEKWNRIKKTNYYY